MPNKLSLIPDFHTRSAISFSAAMICIVALSVHGIFAQETFSAQPATARTQDVVVLVGAEGTPEYGELFATWADHWAEAAAAGEAGVTVIGRDSQGNDLQQFRQAVTKTAAAKTPEPLWIVLIGHGTFDGRTARFNLNGADLAADAAAELLAASQRPLIVINCSSCSAPFINALSGPDRVIITATKDGGEIQFTRFGGYISEAIGKTDADIDRDGQTSLLEAWIYASGKTEEYYKSDGRLATEHSLLDDSGDGRGTRSEVFEGVRLKDNVKNKDALDGKLAKRRHLVRSESERSLTPAQRVERDRLEEKLENLRKRRAEFSEPEYLKQLEEILIPLARLYEQTSVESNVSPAVN